jgi:hypothetical protein
VVIAITGILQFFLISVSGGFSLLVEDVVRDPP